jgi:hypothetical protein
MTGHGADSVVPQEVILRILEDPMKYEREQREAERKQISKALDRIAAMRTSQD